jgi:hypothetical protein
VGVIVNKGQLIIEEWLVMEKFNYENSQQSEKKEPKVEQIPLDIMPMDQQ